MHLLFEEAAGADMETHHARSRRSWSSPGDLIDVSQYRVELVWPKAVTYDSAARLVRLAKEQNDSLEIRGEPIGIADDVYFPADEAAAAAPTGVADDARGAPDEAAAAALDEAAAPETKRRRILGKRVSVSPTSASHVVPRADDAEAASATGPAIAYHAEIGAAPADDAQPATRRRWKSTPTLAEAASAPVMWPSSLLFLKSENICRRFRTESRRFEDVMDKYEVTWRSCARCRESGGGDQTASVWNPFRTSEKRRLGRRKSTTSMSFTMWGWLGNVT